MQENKTNHVETKFLFIFSRSGAELAVGSVSGRLVAAPLPLHPPAHLVPFGGGRVPGIIVTRSWQLRCDQGWLPGGCNCSRGSSAPAKIQCLLTVLSVSLLGHLDLAEELC